VVVDAPDAKVYFEYWANPLEYNQPNLTPGSGATALGSVVAVAVDSYLVAG
jgi:hypothetical protein